MKKHIRVGSRDSRLAIIQSEMVIEAIRRFDPSLEVELVTMKTTGDRILDRTLDQIGGKGLFVKELDLALLRGEVDLTVHSFKDLPMEENTELPILALGAREDPRDVLILPLGKNELGPGPLGCSSQRRRLQLESLFPGKASAPVRGNVQTRLGKLDNGDFSALVLAAAGIKRLGLDSRISRYFSVEEMLPAACQGILAVQGRKGEEWPCLDAFNSTESWSAALAERAFVRALDGGCSAPVAAYARLTPTELRLDGLYRDDLTGKVATGFVEGPRDEATALGTALAEQLRDSILQID